MSFKPTLAVNADFTKITYPKYGSPKLDGIRCSIVGDKALTRTLKAIPNKAIYEALSHSPLNGLDGELIVGDPTAKDVYNKTVSQVMSHDKGRDDVTFFVFDDHTFNEATYRHRLENLFWPEYVGIKIVLLEQVLLHNEEQMMAFEAKCVAAGYEGIILRDPEAPYKYGRSTVNEGYLLKVKRFEDSEAEVIGFVEEMFNGNEAEVNELGRTKRSTHAAGLSGKGTLGAFLVRDAGIEFAIGTGLTAAQRQDFWNQREQLMFTQVKYKFFPVGVKVAPRHPVFLGFRDSKDL
jgi:DNA ligase-1